MEQSFRLPITIILRFLKHNTTQQRKLLVISSVLIFYQQMVRAQEERDKLCEDKTTTGKDSREKTPRINKEQAVINRRKIETTNQGPIRTEHMTKTKTTRPRTNHTHNSHSQTKLALRMYSIHLTVTLTQTEAHPHTLTTRTLACTTYHKRHTSPHTRTYT